MRIAIHKFGYKEYRLNSDNLELLEPIAFALQIVKEMPYAKVDIFGKFDLNAHAKKELAKHPSINFVGETIMNSNVQYKYAVLWSGHSLNAHEYEFCEEYVYSVSCVDKAFVVVNDLRYHTEYVKHSKHSKTEILTQGSALHKAVPEIAHYTMHNVKFHYMLSNLDCINKTSFSVAKKHHTMFIARKFSAMDEYRQQNVKHVLQIASTFNSFANHSAVLHSFATTKALCIETDDTFKSMHKQLKRTFVGVQNVYRQSYTNICAADKTYVDAELTPNRVIESIFAFSLPIFAGCYVDKYLQSIFVNHSYPIQWSMQNANHKLLDNEFAYLLQFSKTMGALHMMFNAQVHIATYNHCLNEIFE